MLLATPPRTWTKGTTTNQFCQLWLPSQRLRFPSTVWGRHSRISRHQAEEKSKEEESGKANLAWCGCYSCLNADVPRTEVSYTCKTLREILTKDHQMLNMLVRNSHRYLHRSLQVCLSTAGWDWRAFKELHKRKRRFLTVSPVPKCQSQQDAGFGNNLLWCRASTARFGPYIFSNREQRCRICSLLLILRSVQE